MEMPAWKARCQHRLLGYFTDQHVLTLHQYTTGCSSLIRRHLWELARPRFPALAHQMLQSADRTCERTRGRAALKARSLARTKDSSLARSCLSSSSDLSSSSASATSSKASAYVQSCWCWQEAALRCISVAHITRSHILMPTAAVL